MEIYTRSVLSAKNQAVLWICASVSLGFYFKFYKWSTCPSVWSYQSSGFQSDSLDYFAAVPSSRSLWLPSDWFCVCVRESVCVRVCVCVCENTSQSWILCYYWQLVTCTKWFVKFEMRNSNLHHIILIRVLYDTQMMSMKEVETTGCATA